MFAQVDSPETLSPLELDSYLEKGWFRMGQTIFTTNYLNFKSQFYSAVWLRVALDGLSTDKTQKKLFKLNTAFRTEIQQASITPLKEALYERYKQNIAFEASPSLNHLLYGKQVHTIFNTQEVNIYDEDKLIACGFFDLGATGAAGITCFYDPAYKKYSLGKYLIYLKLNYCKNLGLQYFYPGYFVPGYTFFDYKLSIATAALQFLQFTTQKWLPIGIFSRAQSPFQLMLDQLLVLYNLLLNSHVACRLLRYEFFDANLIPDLKGAELFDYPLFISFPSSDEYINQLIIYDIRDHKYHLMKCKGVWKTNSAMDAQEIYSSHVLKGEEDLFSTPSPDTLVAVILLEVEHLRRKGSMTKD